MTSFERFVSETGEIVLNYPFHCKRVKRFANKSTMMTLSYFVYSRMSDAMKNSVIIRIKSS